MAWIKRNLYFVIGGLVALGLMGFAGFYNFTGWKHNSDEREKLNVAYEELKRLNNQPVHPGSGKVDNIKLAREQQKEIHGFLGKTAAHFKRIPSIPDSPKVGSGEYASALRLTIDQLQRDATNNSVVLPPKYNFSFEAQRGRVQFAAGSLEPLAVQLGEIKAICEILNAAKVNSFDSIRRERVSADDVSGPQNDYLEAKSQTNELAVLTPYEITFRSFSPELAAVLAGFANSPYGIIVKSVNVEPAAAAIMEPSAMPVMAVPVAVPVAPPAYPYPGTRRLTEGEDAVRRPYARGPAMPQAAPAPMAAAPSTSARAGLPTVLNERQLRVTLHVEIVKLLPKK